MHRLISPVPGAIFQAMVTTCLSHCGFQAPNTFLWGLADHWGFPFLHSRSGSSSTASGAQPHSIPLASRKPVCLTVPAPPLSQMLGVLYQARGEGYYCSSAPSPYSMGDLHPVGKRAFISELIPHFHHPCTPPPFFFFDGCSQKTFLSSFPPLPP